MYNLSCFLWRAVEPNQWAYMSSACKLFIMAATLTHFPQTRLNPRRLDRATMLNPISNQCSKTALDSLHHITTTFNETTGKHDNADPSS